MELKTIQRRQHWQYGVLQMGIAQRQQCWAPRDIDVGGGIITMSTFGPTLTGGKCFSFLNQGIAFFGRQQCWYGIDVPQRGVL